jgi:hypothetical protein
VCLYKASWLVATRRKGRRLVERCPGAFYYIANATTGAIPRTATTAFDPSPCYTKDLRLRIWGGGVDNHGFGRPWRRHRRRAVSAVTWSRPHRPHTALDAPSRSILMAGFGYFLGKSFFYIFLNRPRRKCPFVTWEGSQGEAPTEVAPVIRMFWTFYDQKSMWLPGPFPRCYGAQADSEVIYYYCH